MILTVAAVVMLVGVLMYFLSTNSKIARVGEIMFFVGLFCVLLNVGQALRIFPVR